MIDADHCTGERELSALREFSRTLGVDCSAQILQARSISQKNA